jgi:hypothetical protein
MVLFFVSSILGEKHYFGSTNISPNKRGQYLKWLIHEQIFEQQIEWISNQYYNIKLHMCMNTK